MSHDLSLKLDFISWPIERLLNLLEGLNDDILDILIVVLLVQIINQVIKVFAQLSSETESFVQFPATVDVVFPMEIKFNVHVELFKFFHFNFIGRLIHILSNPEVLNSQIYIRELIIISFIQIA